ncbi:hypothetical protein DsansV1_C28g0205701 [Dioscorea sansibarensis]
MPSFASVSDIIWRCGQGARICWDFGAFSGSECPIEGDIPTLVVRLKNDHKVNVHDGSTFTHRYVKSNLMKLNM